MGTTRMVGREREEVGGSLRRGLGGGFALREGGRIVEILCADRCLSGFVGDERAIRGGRFMISALHPSTFPPIHHAQF